jgi:hypothetical protein
MQQEVPMGAEVLGCGHASQLFRVEYMDGSPQVHLHFLTDDEEYSRSGEGKVELVCHGCGESLLVRYDNSGSKKQFLSIRNRFRDDHAKCQNRSFEHSCPDYRRSFKSIDVRHSDRKRQIA